MPNVDGNLSIKEKEWLETATKYVSSKHLPVLGKMLKIVDDVSLTVGRALFFGIILAALAALGWRLFKWKKDYTNQKKKNKRKQINKSSESCVVLWVK